MKGKLKELFISNDDEVVAAGTEVEIVKGRCGCEGYFYQCKIPGGKQIIINSDNIDVTDHAPYIDWEKHRYELVKNFAAGIVSSHTVEEVNNFFIRNYYGYEVVADLSIKLADTLIKRLKGE